MPDDCAFGRTFRTPLDSRWLLRRGARTHDHPLDVAELGTTVSRKRTLVSLGSRPRRRPPDGEGLFVQILSDWGMGRSSCTPSPKAVKPAHTSIPRPRHRGVRKRPWVPVGRVPGAGLRQAIGGAARTLPLRGGRGGATGQGEDQAGEERRPTLAGAREASGGDQGRPGKECSAMNMNTAPAIQSVGPPPDRACEASDNAQLSTPWQEVISFFFAREMLLRTWPKVLAQGGIAVRRSAGRRNQRTFDGSIKPCGGTGQLQRDSPPSPQHRRSAPHVPSRG
jgi:hypothetical protein